MPRPHRDLFLVSQPGADFGWNVTGIIAGGLSEQLSLVVGFNHLLLLALGYCALSLAGRPRSPSGA